MKYYNRPNCLFSAMRCPTLNLEKSITTFSYRSVSTLMNPCWHQLFSLLKPSFSLDELEWKEAFTCTSCQTLFSKIVIICYPSHNWDVDAQNHLENWKHTLELACFIWQLFLCFIFQIFWKMYEFAAGCRKPGVIRKLNRLMIFSLNFWYDEISLLTRFIFGRFCLTKMRTIVWIYVA